MVVNDKEPNAFATPGYMVVSNGLLRLIEGEEELDAVIAHEMIHLQHEHVEHGFESRSFLQRIGRTRKHETEADLRPLEFLDRKGVNPYGFVKLFEHLEEYQEIKKRELAAELTKLDRKSKGYLDKWIEMHADAKHGSLLDRRLNFSQTSWFIDIRNLSMDLKPLGLNESDLKDYEQDNEILTRFNNLEAAEKRILLKRQFHKYQLDSKLKSDDEKQGFVHLSGLVNKQKQLIEELFPSSSEDKKAEMLLFTLLSDCQVDIETLRKIPALTELADKVDMGLSEPANVIAFLENGLAYESVKIGFNNNSIPAQDLMLRTLGLYLTKQSVINPVSFLELFDKLTFTSEISFEGTVNLLVGKLVEKNQLNREQVLILSDLLRDRPISAHELSLSLGLDASIFGIGPEAYLIDLLEQKRLAKLRETTDPIEFFRYLTLIGEEDLWTRDASANTLISLTDTKLNNIQLLVQTINKELGKPDGKKDLGFFREDSFTSTLDKYLSRMGSEESLSVDSLKHFIEFLGLTMSQESFISFVNRAIEATDFNQITSSDIKSILDSIKQSSKEIPPFQLNKLPKFLQAAKIVYLNEAAQTGDLNKLKEYLSFFPTYNILPSKSVSFEMEGYQEEYPDKAGDPIDIRISWETLTQKVLGEKFPDNNARMEMLLLLSSASENPQVLLQVVPEIALRMVKTVDFNEGVRIIFEKYPQLPKHIFSKALNYLIEEKAKSVADFDLLEEKVKASIEGFVSDEETLGAMAISDAFLLEPAKSSERSLYTEGLSFIKAKGFDPLELMQSLLVFESDQRLKNYMFERWWLSNQFFADPSSSYRKIFNLSEYLVAKNAPNSLEFWKKELPAESNYKPFSEILSDIYLMDRVMKFALLRKILTGSSGVLANSESKSAFAEFVSNSLLSSEDSQGLDFTKGLINSFFHAGNQEELFDRASAILADLILNPPEQSYGYKNLAFDYAKQFLDFDQARGNISFRTKQEMIYHVTNVTVKILNLIGRRGMNNGTANASADLRLLEEFSAKNGHDRAKRFTPWDLAITVGQKSGALGVRMLQLAGQYFDIPLEKREALDNVYDQNVGQSRLQAYRTLKREAETSPDIARFLENVEEFGPRIGGGSLMTVYEFKMKDGTREAVAVRNPNVIFHLDRTVALLRKTLNEARQKNPQDQSYQLIEVLLDDVSDWIKDELSDPEFEIKDQLFKIQNDGWFPDSNDAKKILIPESLPTGTRWVRRDRFIGGRNLTSLQVSSDTNIVEGKISQEDLAQSTSLIIKNFVNQLFETGLVHPDMHPGNIRITTDGTQVAIFDRYNLLKLSEQDKEFVGGLVAASAFGVAALQEQIGNYLFSLDDNAEKIDKKDQVLSEVGQIFQNAENSEKGLIGAMVHLKRSGIVVPRHISLIAKNLYSLNNLAVKAGFSNLVEAYMVA